MNYLMTGATGFIGRALVDLLLQQGHTVNYFARRRSDSLDGRAAFHAWQTDEEAPLSSIPRLDAIVHLAGEPIAQRWNREVKERIYASRVEGTRNLVSAIGKLRYKPSVLITASAVGYYGDRGDEVLTEESAPGTGFLSDVCVAWEREAARAREFGLRVVPVRIATVLGLRGGALPRMLIPFRLGIGGKFGNGRQWMSWIHLQDLTNLIVFAVNNPSVESPLNGSSPNPVTNADFTRHLGEGVHRPAIFQVPQFALRLAMGEMAAFLFESLRVLPAGAAQSGFQFQYATLDQALRDLLKTRQR